MPLTSLESVIGASGSASSSSLLLLSLELLSLLSLELLLLLAAAGLNAELFGFRLPPRPPLWGTSRSSSELLSRLSLLDIAAEAVDAAVAATAAACGSSQPTRRAVCSCGTGESKRLRSSLRSDESSAWKRVKCDG